MASFADGQASTAVNGSVRGQVICGDTQRPARLAHVVLQPIVDLKSPTLQKKKDPDRMGGVFTLTPTGLDGSFVIANVPPGHYYVIAEQNGYASPLSNFTPDQLNHPDAATLDRVAQLMTSVAVTAGHTSEVEVTLRRGGAISGTVHYDDGSPAIRVPLALVRRGKDGKWTEVQSRQLADGFGGYVSDDRGEYRVPGLLAGEYLVKATLSWDSVSLEHIFGDAGSMFLDGGYQLSFFPGDAIRPKDAKSIKVEDGAESAVVDIDVPVSNLYAVSGSVVQAGTPHVVNAAKVTLVFADDETVIAQADVSKEDGQFHFLFVPPGTYKLKVTGARDVTRTEVPGCPQGNLCMPPMRMEEKTVKAYADASQALSVQSEVTGLSIGVTTAAQQAQQ